MKNGAELLSEHAHLTTVDSFPLHSKAVPSDPAAILEAVLQLRESVGDGLNDAEFTHFIREKLNCSRSAFSILSCAEGFLTFNVPEQDPADWYSAGHWIAPDKESIAREVAGRYELTLCEPPDKLGYIIPPPNAHHHLEWMTRWDSVAIAHPYYLKVRISRPDSRNPLGWTTKGVFAAGSNLLRDLTALYT